MTGSLRECKKAGLRLYEYCSVVESPLRKAIWALLRTAKFPRNTNLFRRGLDSVKLEIFSFYRT